jgi:hypothetical protein
MTGDLSAERWKQGRDDGSNGYDPRYSDRDYLDGWQTGECARFYGPSSDWIDRPLDAHAFEAATHARGADDRQRPSPLH